MPPPHFTDESFELYLLNLADEDLKKKIEEHLLGCDLCLDEIKKVEKLLMAMRTSLEESAVNDRAKILMARLAAGDLPLFKPFVN